MAKAASITAGLVTKKGEAVPSVGVKETVELKQTASTATVYYKALTMKLDRARYEALKKAGIELDKKSQEILVEALDLWLSSQASRER